jgi:hypothetical protein
MFLALLPLTRVSAGSCWICERVTDVSFERDFDTEWKPMASR